MSFSHPHRRLSDSPRTWSWRSKASRCFKMIRISEGLYTHVNIVFDGFVSWGCAGLTFISGQDGPGLSFPLTAIFSMGRYLSCSFKWVESLLAATSLPSWCVCVCVWSLRCKACACSGSGPSLLTLYGPVQLRHASMHTLLRLLVAVVCVLCHPHCGLNMTAFQIKTTVKYYNKCLYNIRFNY